MLSALRGSSGTIPAPSVAAIAAVLHLAVLAGRVPVRHGHCTPRILLAWPLPSPNQTVNTETEDCSSNPTQVYCAGELALTFGMAVIVLARWLHISRINGSRAY